MAACHVGAVAGGRILDQLHIAEQPRSRVAAFEQVVAEDAVLRQPAGEGAFEGVDVVDALADERAFTEPILVDVGHGARVGVDAGVAAAQPRVAAAVAAGQTDTDARLQDAVALGHDRAVIAAAEARPVQRVRHRRDELRGGVARQLRVGVQRDDVANTGQRAGVAHDVRESLARARLRLAAQQRIQVGELAALALMAHPYPLARIPAARSMEQEEGVARVAVGRRAIARVERGNLRAGRRHQHLVAWQMLAGGIVEVGQQTIVQVGVAIGQEAHLQRLDQRIDALGTAEQGGHDDQGARGGPDAVGKIHARQGLGHDQQRGRPVHQGQRELARGQQQQRSDGQQAPPRPTECAVDLAQRAGRQRQRAQPHRAAVQYEPRAAGAPLQSEPGWSARAGGLLERLTARPDEVEADMSAPRIGFGAGRWAGIAGQLHGKLRHLGLRPCTQARDAFDRMAVLVAGAEIHLRVDAGRVGAQGLLHAAQRLDELAPVHSAEQAQAADAVADSDLAGGLLLALGMHQLFDGLARLGQALLHPGQRHRQRGAPALQTARELGHEGARHLRLRTQHVGDYQDQVGRRLGCDGQHLVGPDGGPVTLFAAGGNAGGDPAQVFDQCQPQHDRNGPQLAEQQRLHALVGRHEAAQGAAGDATVAVRDEFQRQVIDPRQPARHAVDRFARQARQLAAVAARQVPARDADLFLDEVEVVEQPLRRRCQAQLGRHGGGQQLANLDQHRRVGSQAREQAVRPAGRAEDMHRCQLLAAQRHLVGAEQRRAQGFVLVGAPRCAAQACPPAARGTLGGFEERREIRHRGAPAVSRTVRGGKVPRPLSVGLQVFSSTDPGIDGSTRKIRSG